MKIKPNRQQNTMKSLVAAAALLVAGTGFAQGNAQYDYATVLEVEPITRLVQVTVPREECWREQVVHQEPARRDSHTGTILGGIIGAAVGNELGHSKRNKQVGAVAGALLGASIGSDVSRPRHSSGRTYTTWEDRCKTIQETHQEERIDGYRVTYRYNGETYTTRTHRDPGDSLRVKLSVTPVF